MKEPKATEELGLELGLSPRQFELIEHTLGRFPNYTELRILASFWRQAYSHASQAALMQTLPGAMNDSLGKYARHTVGFIPLGNDLLLALSVSSRTIAFPSQARKRAVACVAEGARALAACGTRPDALFCFVSLGSSLADRKKNIVQKTAAGVKAFAKGTGIKTVSLQSTIHDDGHALFSCLSLGMARKGRIIEPQALGEGNSIFLLGAKSGYKDRIDIPLEKSLLAASQELAQRSYLVGMRSLSQGGVAIACAEMASESKSGIALNLGRIRVQEAGIHPAEILLSETSGRLLVVLTRGFEKELRSLCSRHQLTCSEIGKVNGREMLTVTRRTKIHVSLPLTLFAEGAETPDYRLAARRPEYLQSVVQLNLDSIREPRSYTKVLLDLLKSRRIRADSRSVLSFGGNASGEACLQMDKSHWRVLCSTSSGGRFSYLDPRSGGRCAVAMSSRNVVCRAAKPLATTICLSFGDSSDPEESYVLKEAVKGIEEACRVLELPVVSGCIDRHEKNRHTMPVVTTVAVVEDEASLLTLDFKDAGDFILILGSHRGELGGSEYLATIHNQRRGTPPHVDLPTERGISEILLVANRVGLIKSAHHVSSGGLAVAIAQCVMASEEGTGARIHISSKIRNNELLFGETQGLLIVTVEEDSIIEIERLCMRMGVPCTAIGRVTDSGLYSFNDLISIAVKKLKSCVF